MSENFGKIFERFFDSSIMEESVIARYVMMSFIIIADRRGLIDKSPETLSRRLHLSVSELNEAIKVLESPDPSSRTADCEGRRIIRIREYGWGWKLVNKEKYSALRTFDKQEYQRDYMARYEKKKPESEGKTFVLPEKRAYVSVSESSSGEGGGGETSSRQEDEQVFDAWVETLPDNGGRPHLFNDKRRSKVRARRRDGYPLQDLLDAVRGWKYDKWEERWKNNDLAVLLRDGGQLEKFRDMYRNQGNGKPPQPPRVARSGGKPIEEHTLVRNRLNDLVHKLRMTGRERSVYFSKVANSPADKLSEVEAELGRLLHEQAARSDQQPKE